VQEVARQIDGALFERAVLNPPILSTVLRELHTGAASTARRRFWSCALSVAVFL
jgi:hypothetical protein